MKVLLVWLFFTLTFAQNSLAIENSHQDYDRYKEAWQNATLSQVEAWLQTNPDINAEDSNLWTVLVRASHHNQNPEVIKRLLGAGADPNQTYLSGYTALMNAAQWNTPEVVQALIEGGADPNAKGEDGETVIMYAAKWNPDPDVLSILIKVGADPTAIDNFGSNLLMLAAQHNTGAAVIQTLLETGFDANMPNESGTTALMTAALSYNSRPNIVKALVEGGANVNTQDGFGRTALIYATSRNDISVVKVLLELGADPLIEAKDGVSALEVAIENNHQELIDLLKASSE